MEAIAKYEKEEILTKFFHREKERNERSLQLWTVQKTSVDKFVKKDKC